MTDDETLVLEVLRALKSVATPPCALHEPTFGGNAPAFVVDCIRTGWVSSVGSYVNRFEQIVTTGGGGAISDQIFRETVNIPSGCGILANHA